MAKPSILGLAYVTEPLPYLFSRKKPASLPRAIFILFQGRVDTFFFLVVHTERT